jgi:hypothetical protein
MTENTQILISRLEAQASPKAIAVTPQQNVADLLLSQEASRYFLQRYFAMTFGFLVVSTVLLFLFATPAFRTACYFGMAFPIVSSFVSFLVTEWAYEQPSMLFMTVSLLSIVIRMFNLLIAFCVGYLIIRMSAGGLIVGLLATYFGYLAIEIAYVHNKGKLLGQ